MCRSTVCRFSSATTLILSLNSNATASHLTLLQFRGNLSTHLGRLEEAGYVAINKEFKCKKRRTTISPAGKGRAAFRERQKSMRQVLDELPD